MLLIVFPCYNSDIGICNCQGNGIVISAFGSRIRARVQNAMLLLPTFVCAPVIRLAGLDYWIPLMLHTSSIGDV
jgi:hypothetical protein